MKVVFWVGPTGSGKSDVALTMAEKFAADIVNADSVQMYRGIDKGSAKPTASDFARRPHHLFDLVSYPQAVTAGDFNRHFFELMKVQESQKHPQFVVGGTGFYFQAIEKGILEIPKTNPQVQARLMEELQQPGGEEKLHARLQSLDPVAAQRIHAHDHYRLTRALDIIEATGESLTAALEKHKNQQAPFPYPLLKIGLRLEKTELEARIQRRTEQMLQNAWLDEVKQLLEQGLGQWEPLSSVGYKECVQFLRGEIKDRQTLSQTITRETLRLAKKQRTWFGRDPQIQWFHPTQLPQIESLLQEFLAVPSTK